MAILDERGYLIPAVNSNDVDYVKCAIELAYSIRYWHPEAKICLMTNIDCEESVFDHKVMLPYGDISDGSWKLSNDWQSFHATPFRQTIKLEADMIAASPIDHWWTLFELKDVVISQGARNIYDQKAESRYYRKTFDNNSLPDVYNAITYWRYSKTATDFFRLVQEIFQCWDSYKGLLKFPDSIPTTDVVYAIAANIIGPENVMLPEGIGPTIVHMKRHMIPTHDEDWTKELIWENTDMGLRLQTIAQRGFVHYHIKEWADEYRNDRKFLGST